MGIFAPNPVVRPEFVRPRGSSDVDRVSVSSRKSLNRKSFDTARSTLDASSNNVKCWSWSLKNDFLPQPQIQYLMEQTRPAAFPQRSLPSPTADSRSFSVHPSQESIRSSQTIASTPERHYKRSSDVPSLVSDKSCSSFESSNGPSASPVRSLPKTSFSRPFYDGKPPRFPNPCDVPDSPSPRDSMRPARRSYERSRALIPAPSTPPLDEETSLVKSEEQLKLLDTRFYFERRHPMTRQSFNAETIFSQASTINTDSKTISVSVPGSRSPSPKFPTCQNINEYIRRPLPPLPPAASSTGSPQSRQCRTLIESRPRSVSLQSSASASSASSIEHASYKLFPTTSRAVRREPVVYRPTRVAIPPRRVIIVSDSSCENSFNSSTSSSDESSFSHTVTPNTSFGSNATSKSELLESEYLRELRLREDVSRIIASFPIPPSYIAAC